MRKMDLSKDANIITFTNAITGRCPFTDSVYAKKSRLLIWRGEKCRSRMREVVLGKEEFYIFLLKTADLM